MNGHIAGTAEIALLTQIAKRPESNDASTIVSIIVGAKMLPDDSKDSFNQKRLAEDTVNVYQDSAPIREPA